MKRTVLTIAVALALVVAGCSGGPTTGASTIDDPTATTTLDSTVEDPAIDDGAGSLGTVSLYVSDERNAIGDFKHLNITITRVGFKPVNESLAADSAETAGETTAETAGDANETATPTVDNARTDANETNKVGTNETTSHVTNETTSADDGDQTTDAPVVGPGNDTEPPANGDSDRERGEPGREQAAPDRERVGWLEHTVEDRTFDLTTLQGDNASLLGDMDVPAGEYQQVFVYVSEVNGTLTSGEQVRVKLPSEKLHLNKGFTVSANDSVDFVFDITVFGAGNSGKYILKPVVSESGPDQEIRNVDEQRGERGQERARDRLEAAFVDSVEPGTNATISVRQNGTAVPNATVSLDDQRLGTTNASGMVTVEIPASATELDLAVAAGDTETALTWEAAETDDASAGTPESGTEDEPGPPDDPGRGNDKQVQST